MSRTILILCLLTLAMTMRIHEQQVARLDEGKYTLQDASGKYLVDACFQCTQTEEEHLVVLKDIPQFSASKNLQAVWTVNKMGGKIWFANSKGIKLFSSRKNPENVFLDSTFLDQYNQLWRPQKVHDIWVFKADEENLYLGSCSKYGYNYACANIKKKNSKRARWTINQVNL